MYAAFSLSTSGMAVNVTSPPMRSTRSWKPRGGIHGARQAPRGRSRQARRRAIAAVGRLGVERVGIQEGPVDEYQRAGYPLVGQSPQQPAEQPRAVPVRQHVPGVVEVVGAEPGVGTRPQRHHRVLAAVKPQLPAVQLQAVDDTRRRVWPRPTAHPHLLSRLTPPTTSAAKPFQQTNSSPQAGRGGAHRAAAGVRPDRPAH